MILFSTGCPKCKILTKKLDESGLSYDVCTDIEKMESLGIESVPVLEVNGKLMGFSEAMRFVTNGNGGDHI